MYIYIYKNATKKKFHHNYCIIEQLINLNMRIQQSLKINIHGLQLLVFRPMYAISSFSLHSKLSAQVLFFT